MTARRRSVSRTGSSLKNSSDISSSSKILRNLLILEADLARQLEEKRVLQLQFTIFLSVLFAVALACFYQILVLDNYSVYLIMIFLFICITFVLFRMSGEYHRTIVIPRRYLGIVNKGLRQFNCKMVKVNYTWTEMLIDTMKWINRAWVKSVLYIWIDVLGPNRTHNGYIVQNLRKLKIRLQPRCGVVRYKLVLNPRSFNAEIREGWEIYRDEFWAREGARRRRIANSTDTTI